MKYLGTTTHIKDIANRELLDDAVKALIGQEYSGTMACYPSVAFIGDTVTTVITMNMNYVTEDSSALYSDSERTQVITSPQTVSTDTTFYGRLTKNSINVDLEASVNFYNKIYYGIAATASDVVSAGIYHSEPSASARYKFFNATNGSGAANPFWICVPNDVAQPMRFSMSGIECTMTRTDNVVIGSITYTTYNSTPIAVNATVNVLTEIHD